MPRIDINSPSQAEDFDVANNTIASETVPPVVEAETAPYFTDVKPEFSPATPPAEASVSVPEAASTEAVITAPTVQKTLAEPFAGSRPTRRTLGRILLEAVLAIAVVGLSLWSWNLYADRQNLTNQLSKVNANPQALVEKQTQALIDRVGLLMQLPTGETPTVAAVSDAAAAKQQSAFFANAANGDKVLMYVKAGEAILYRPSTNKIILLAPLTFNSAAASTNATTKK